MNLLDLFKKWNSGDLPPCQSNINFKRQHLFQISKRVVGLGQNLFVYLEFLVCWRNNRRLLPIKRNAVDLDIWFLNFVNGMFCIVLWTLRIMKNKDIMIVLHVLLGDNDWLFTLDSKNPCSNFADTSFADKDNWAIRIGLHL